MNVQVAAPTWHGSGRQLALIVASSGWWGSVGDDALLRTTCAALTERGMEPWVLVNQDRDKWQQALAACQATAMTPRELASPRGLLTALRLRHIFIIGADIMDGGFETTAVLRRLFLARMFRRLGKQVSIINFSFNKQPKEEVLQGFQRLGKRVRYTARDRRSLSRFEAATGLSAAPVADMGFLTQPQRSTQVNEFAAWADRMRAEGHTLLMINTSIAPFRSDPATAQATPREIADALHKALAHLDGLVGMKLAVALAPHDFRFPDNPESDVSLAAALGNELQAEMGERMRTLPTPFNSAEVCAMAAHVDLVVTGRMHLAILSLTAGVVPVSFTYQDKFEGMYEHVFADPAGLTLSTRVLMESPAAIGEALKQVLDRREALQAEITAARPRVIEAARGNFNS